MKKFMNFLDKIFKDPKTNVLLILLFGFFATLELASKQYFYAFADFCIVMGESFSLIDNCRRKEEEKLEKDR